MGSPAARAPAGPAPKFETTARFARGRIIDALREAPADIDELAAILPGLHSERTGIYLAALEKDGLVSHDAAGTWALA